MSSRLTLYNSYFLSRGTPHDFTVDKRTGVAEKDDDHITIVTGLGDNEIEKRNHLYIKPQESRFEIIGESVMTQSATVTPSDCRL